MKNYRLAIGALARMKRGPGDHRLPTLVLVGDGKERRDLETLARNLGVLSEVRFLGWRDDVDRLYGAFDLYTLVSRSEGTSISLLEAMASSLCPVVTDVGGNREVLGAGFEALLVRSEDEAGLSAAWHACLANPGFRDEMGRRARQRVEGAYSLDGMVDQYVSLYQELLGNRRALPGAERA